MYMKIFQNQDAILSLVIANKHAWPLLTAQRLKTTHELMGSL